MNSTVKKMYKNNYSKSVVIPMLPTNTGFDWWVEYEANSEVLDRAFSTRFASYNYEPLLDDPEDMDELMLNFKSDVRALFLMNSKKYAELYRIHTVADEELPISYNYDMIETMDRDTTNQNISTQGSRSDSTNEQSTNIFGARSDTSSENSANTKGQRTDIDNLEVGNQKHSDVNKVTAFNSNNENTNTSMASEVGSRNDVRQFTEGQQTQTMQDQLTFNKGAETDTVNLSTTFNKGAETDNSNGSATEDYTLTRKGNIGVQTGADIARIFTDFWNSPKALFYNTIFDDICMMYLNLR